MVQETTRAHTPYFRVAKALWEACGEGRYNKEDHPNADKYAWKLFLEQDMDYLSTKYGFQKVCELLKDVAQKEYVHINTLGIDFGRVRRASEIRNNWASALQSAQNGEDLSFDIGFGFYESDKAVLLDLHKEGKFRKKIEDLLGDCNFHTFCSLLSQGKYEEAEELIEMPV